MSTEPRTAPGLAASTAPKICKARGAEIQTLWERRARFAGAVSPEAAYFRDTPAVTVLAIAAARRTILLSCL